MCIYLKYLCHSQLNCKETALTTRKGQYTELYDDQEERLSHNPLPLVASCAMENSPLSLGPGEQLSVN